MEYQSSNILMWYQRAARQPTWVTKLAITAAVIVLALPLLVLVALVLLAVATGAVVFVTLALVVGAARWLGSIFKRPLTALNRNGRRNVRVMHDE